MFSHEIYLLVTCLITLNTAIRVDWNTNTGPIVPPTPRTTVRPFPPYRAPAPVWEDQSNDIPNPNSYVYVLPPPSRPRTTNNYLTSDRRPVTQTNYNNYNNHNYGHIVASTDAHTYYQSGNSNVVASLSPQYIPNVGIKYTAVVPSSTKPTKNYYGGDKVQGKFNAKTKKYKAYEKAKYVPLNYYPLFEFALPEQNQYRPEFDQEQLVRQQQLPLPETSQAFKAESAQQQKRQTQTSKLAHEKDAVEKPSKRYGKNDKKEEKSNLGYSSNAILNAKSS